MSSHFLSSELLTQAELLRISLMSSVLTQALASVDVPFSFAVCGSVAFGCAHDMSDIELFFVVDKHDIRAFTDSHVFADIFAVRYPSNIISEVERGTIDALRIPEIPFHGITLSANIYTTNLCSRIANLTLGPVAKYRQTAKTEVHRFRGFDWHHTGSTAEYSSDCHAYDGGYISLDRIMFFESENAYFHIYVDKLLGAFLLWDELNVRQLQGQLHQNLVKLCHATHHVNPLGFMYKINAATSNQHNQITQHRQMHIRYDQQIAQFPSSLIQISGPTGVGKDTLISLLIQQAEMPIAKIPCVTTRAPRAHENNEYQFVSVPQFLSMIRHERFFFWHMDGRDATGTMKFYGILYDDIIPLLTQQSSVVFSIGGSTAARLLKRRYPGSTSIWIQPDSIDQLKHQIYQRQGALDAEMNQRLEKLVYTTLYASHFFDASITNYPDCISETFTQMCDVLDTHVPTGVFV